MFYFKKLSYLFFRLFLLPVSGFAQLDSLENALIAKPKDSLKVALLFDLSKKNEITGQL